MSLFQTALYLRYYDMVVFQCRHTKKRFWGARLLSVFGKTTTIPLGCESFDFTSSIPTGISQMHELLEALQNEDLFKFIYLAAFRPGKMHAWLVRAIAPVLRKFPDARVLFCGKGGGPEFDETCVAIREEGVERQILLPGVVSRDEVPWLLTHCNCAVVPSCSETFGHGFLEPMFAGLPVLGTSVGIGCDIIKDYETGFVFSLKEPNALRRKVEWILQNRASAAGMGAKAMSTVLESYTHEKIAKWHVALYTRLLGGMR